MATVDVTYAIYAGTLAALQRALEAHDVDGLIVIYNSIARLPEDEQPAARLAMKDLAIGARRTADEFRAEGAVP
jgi:hypothetical protein